MCPFVSLCVPLFPFMPLYCLCPFIPLCKLLHAFTHFYTLYKLSSSQDLIVGLVFIAVKEKRYFRYYVIWRYYVERRMWFIS